MKKAFLQSPREEIWPWWSLIFSSVVFTFACPGLMIARKLYIARRKSLAFLISFFSLAILGLYLFSTIYWGLFWQTAFFIHVLVSIVIGFLWVGFQKLLSNKLFGNRASPDIWPREQEGLRKANGFTSIVSAALLIFAATLGAYSFRWLPHPFIVLEKGGRFLFGMLGIVSLISIPFIFIFCYMWQRKYGHIPTRTLACYTLGIFGIFICFDFIPYPFYRLSFKFPAMLNIYAFGDIELNNYFKVLSSWIIIFVTVPLALYMSDSRTVKMLFLRGFCVVGLICLFNIQNMTWDSTYVHYLFFKGDRNINSLDAQERKRAVSQLEKYFRVFPNCKARGDLVLLLSQRYLLHGQKDKARQLLSSFISKDKENPDNLRYVRKARSILSRVDTLEPAEPEFIEDVPIIRPAEFLTPEWQALLTMLKFWRKDMLPEEFKAELVKISTTEDRINLLELKYLIQFKEFARRLGYQTFFKFGNVEGLNRCMREKIPVLVKIGNNYCPVLGYDACTKQFGIFTYFAQFKEEGRITRRRVKESIYMDKVSILESERREYKENFKKVISWWEEDCFKSDWQLRGNIIAFFFPEGEGENYLEKLGFNIEEVKLQTKAISLFSLASLYEDRGDKSDAIRLFWKAHQLIPERRLFSQRIHICRMALEKVSSDPRVRDLGLDFDSKRHQNWKKGIKGIKAEDLESCEATFEKDYKNGRLYIGALKSYLNLWDENFVQERKHLIHVLKSLIDSYTPSHSYGYRTILARVYRRNRNYKAFVREREDMALIKPADEDNRIELAKGYSELADFDLSWREWKKVCYVRRIWQPEYYYVICQRFSKKGLYWLAGRFLELSLMLDKTQPKYHIAKARLLIKMKRPDDARRMLQWVLEIYTDEKEREKAEVLIKRL